MKKISVSKKFHKGGVSIFIVVIVAILVSIMAVSFLRIMLRDQEQASKLDLSQSAYDSAQAGVEDAKRFLHRYQQECGSGTNLTTNDCKNMATAMNADSTTDCYVLATAGIGKKGSETQVQTTTGGNGTSNDATLNQAYTCVKIQKNTPDFLGKVEEGQSTIVPLKGSKEFSQVRISWHSQKDLTDKNSNVTLDEINTPMTSGVDNSLLLSREQWTRRTNSPAILKTQFFGYQENIKNQGGVLSALDNNSFTSGTGLSEIMLFPARGVEASEKHSLPLLRRGNDANKRTNNISPVKCEENMTTTGREYSCSTTISLMRNVARTDAAYMRLTPIYRGADFKAELLDNNNNLVFFDGVQPKVDSTGRANTQFRRVESRISLEDQNFPLPEFALQLEDDGQPLCKDFWVTNKTNSGMDCKIP